MVHDRYKDLSLVEWAFRCSKTVNLEVRPLYVRTDSHTRGHALYRHCTGHVFVVMLSYLIIAELSRCWQGLDMTVEEEIKELDTLCVTQLVIKEEIRCNRLPQPRESLARLLQAAQVVLPEILPSKGVVVATSVAFH